MTIFRNIHHEEYGVNVGAAACMQTIVRNTPSMVLYWSNSWKVPTIFKKAGHYTCPLRRLCDYAGQVVRYMLHSIYIHLPAIYAVQGVHHFVLLDCVTDVYTHTIQPSLYLKLPVLDVGRQQCIDEVHATQCIALYTAIVTFIGMSVCDHTSNAADHIGSVWDIYLVETEVGCETTT